jgi:hypothetical protein
MAAPFSFADRVKQRADMLAVAERYTRLRRAGRQFVGLCPFHKERHASFFVHPQKKVFCCFGCGAGGDIFAFVMRAERCDFRSALKIVRGLSLGIARSSGPVCGPRFRTGVRAALVPAKRALSHSPKHSRTVHDAWRGPLPPGCDLSRPCEPDTFGEPRAFLLVRNE